MGCRVPWAAALPAALYNVAWRATPIGSQQPAASSQQPAASSQQPAASSQQPAASSQQPAASSQQPAASSQQPAASSQQPAASSQQAHGWGRPRQHQGSPAPKDFTALLAISMFHSVPPGRGSPPACPPFLQPQIRWLLVGPGPAAWLAASPVPVCCQVSHRVGQRPGGESPPATRLGQPARPAIMHAWRPSRRSRTEPAAGRPARAAAAQPSVAQSLATGRRLPRAPPACTMSSLLVDRCPCAPRRGPAAARATDPRRWSRRSPCLPCRSVQHSELDGGAGLSTTPAACWPPRRGRAALPAGAREPPWRQLLPLRPAWGAACSSRRLRLAGSCGS